MATGARLVELCSFYKSNNSKADLEIVVLFFDNKRAALWCSRMIVPLIMTV